MNSFETFLLFMHVIQSLYSLREHVTIARSRYFAIFNIDLKTGLILHEIVHRLSTEYINILYA